MPERSTGFTLIELMIGIAIMAMLLLLAMPYTGAWVDGNRQMQARNQLWEGISQARALALRNPGNSGASEMAAQLKLAGGQLQVLRAGSTTPAWTSGLNASVALKLTDKTDFSDAAALQASGNQGFVCVAFNSRGLRLPDATGCSQTVASQGRIAVGLRDQEPLYVDML